LKNSGIYQLIKLNQNLSVVFKIIRSSRNPEAAEMYLKKRYNLKVQQLVGFLDLMELSKVNLN
jgi:hypothetical protein